FDEINKKETLKIIKYFLERGNQVQIATKKYVSYDDIKYLIPLIKYYGQLVIYVSSSTITHYEKDEVGTCPPDMRFRTFDLISHDIPVVLYMKPVLQSVTIEDLSEYKKLIIDKHISNVVVGSLFTEDVGTEPVHFSNETKLFYSECDDEKVIIKELNSITKVWRRSTEVMNRFKDDARKIDKISEEVDKLLKSDHSGHGIEHINRVYKMSLRFATNENADLFVVSLIALLHEVDDYKLFGEASACNLTNAKMIMDKTKIDSKTQERVLESIKTIGYKKSLAGIRPASLEGMIVSDADMCDGLGATGILRTFEYQKNYGRPFFNKNVFPNGNVNRDTYNIVDDCAVCHCFDKLLRLKSIMLTNSGKEEASRRHDIVVSFLYHLFKEENAPEWTEYLDNFLENLKS
ncbi:MAG TPA: hypothetical protein DCY94_04920, partial [Firmicutes bacterium]|nr:hypothetical protein [Bacillota bacterium]